MTSAELGGIITTVTIFLVVQLVATTWRASTINTTLVHVKETLDKLAEAVSRHDSDFYTKVEAARDFERRDTRLNAAWEKIEKHNEIITIIKAKYDL